VKGQIGVACDNRENFALDFGKHYLFFGTEKSIDQLFLDIDSVTADEIQTVAAALFADDKLTTLVYT
jgi:predicted Zn-dependent peptidase